MFDYELIYRRKQHYITIPQRQSRKLYFGNQHLHNLLKHQKPNENFFITKYSLDGIVSHIILDFDDDEASHKNAYREVTRLRKWILRKDLNAVVVDSTNKGYHIYIQIPPRAFGNDEFNAGVDRDVWFNKFVEYLIQSRKFKYKTLDSTNTSAGLRGNIRIIGSIHPKTQQRVRIIDGEFKDLIEPCDYEWDCFNRAYEFAQNHPSIQKLDEKARLKKHIQKYDSNPIQENDLRILMPQIFGGETKSYPKGYIMMQCPFHNDSKPSMVIQKDFYFCKSCNAKGNWWTLRKMGYVDFPKEELIRVKKVKI